jgi:hypothetical protein
VVGTIVIWFNVREAREHLLRNGHVYTLRPKRRREGKDVLMFGRFGKRGTIYVRFVKEVKSDSELQNYVGESGFKSVEEWRRKAGKSRFLYYVELVGGR